MPPTPPSSTKDPMNNHPGRRSASSTKSGGILRPSWNKRTSPPPRLRLEQHEPFYGTTRRRWRPVCWARRGSPCSKIARPTVLSMPAPPVTTQEGLRRPINLGKGGERALGREIATTASGPRWRRPVLRDTPGWRTPDYRAPFACNSIRFQRGGGAPFDVACSFATGRRLRRMTLWRLL